MFMRKYLYVCALLLPVFPAPAQGAQTGFSQPATAEDIGHVYWSIGTTGENLPAGSGSATQGKPLFEQHCASCHGVDGEGTLANRLVGGVGTLGGTTPVKTVGSYWPYATTLFDYMRRAMPYQTPGVLSDDQVYAVTAYLLFINGIIGERVEMNAATLPAVRMPNRENFSWAFEAESEADSEAQ